MAKLAWRNVVEDIATTAAESLASATHGRTIMNQLVSAGRIGLSFSQLKELVQLTPGSLTHELTTLERGGLVENFLERRPESKDYSFYRTTSIGEVTLNEYELFFEALQRQLARSSKSPEVRRLIEPEELTPFSHDRIHFEKYAGEVLAATISLKAYSVGIAEHRGLSPRRPAIYPDVKPGGSWTESQEPKLPHAAR